MIRTFLARTNRIIRGLKEWFWLQLGWQIRLERTLPSLSEVQDKEELRKEARTVSGYPGKVRQDASPSGFDSHSFRQPKDPVAFMEALQALPRYWEILDLCEECDAPIIGYNGPLHTIHRMDEIPTCYCRGGVEPMNMNNIIVGPIIYG